MIIYEAPPSVGAEGLLMALFHFHRNVSFDFKGAGPWEGETGGEVFDGAVVGVRTEGEGMVAVKEGGENVIKAGVLFG